MLNLKEGYWPGLLATPELQAKLAAHAANTAPNELVVLACVATISGQALARASQGDGMGLRVDIPPARILQPGEDKLLYIREGQEPIALCLKGQDVHGVAYWAFPYAAPVEATGICQLGVVCVTP